jgi:exoribonuclease II
MSDRGDFIGDPWWKNKEQPEDYTKRRTGAITYTMDDLIGRRDLTKYKPVTTDATTVSGTGDVLV